MLKKTAYVYRGEAACPEKDLARAKTRINHIKENILDLNKLWFEQLRLNHTKNFSIKEMSSIVNCLQTLMREYNYSLLNKVLDIIDENSSVEFVIICLRTTYSIRDKLNSWEKVLNRDVKFIPKDRFILRGLNERFI
jgi:DNA polymerase III delta prime subunit